MKNTILAGIIFVLIPSAIFGQSASDVLAKAHLFGQSVYLEFTVAMTIHSGPTEKSRNIEILMRDRANESQVFMQVISPPFLKEMKFLQHSLSSGETLQWMATSRGTRKITSSGTDERVFDSDFTASDFTVINSRNYNILDFQTVPFNGVTVFRLDVRPTEGKDLWDYRRLYIDQESFLILRVDYFKTGAVAKRYSLEETQIVDGLVFPRNVKMEDLRADSFTLLQFTKVDTPSSLPDRVFHYRNM